MTNKPNPKSNSFLYKLTTGICSIVLSVTLVYVFVHAGNIDSPGSPSTSGRMYTLEQIYQKLANGTSATKNTSFNSPSGAPGSTMHTLDDIYNSIPSAGSNVTGGNGLLTFTIPNGIYSGSKTATAGDTNLQAGNIKNNVSIFGVTGNARSAGLLKTNQTICYDTGGFVVTCSGTGQDGELLKGTARSYTDNNDGTITDNSTGLVWQKCSAGLSGTNCEIGSAVTVTWANALTYCNANTDALPGSGWRLPNIYELYSLVDFGVASVPFTNVTYFPTFASSSNYWSSTSRPASSTSAMYVGFSSGNASGGFNKITSCYFRCVR